MSSPVSISNERPVESKAELVEFLAGGEKVKADWRIGTEHEKFGFDSETLRPLPYDGARGIRAMLEGMTRFGWALCF